MRITGKIGAGAAHAELYIADGRLAPRPGAVPSQACELGGEDLRVAPGLIDIQINGYDGVDFNDSETGAEQIAAAARKLWRTGVTAFCPTIITESSGHISKCISNLLREGDEPPDVACAMIGVHVEGPFISPEDGPRGAHPKRHTRAPDWDEFQRWQDDARGQIRIVTLSPEWPGAIEFIEHVAA